MVGIPCSYLLGYTIDLRANGIRWGMGIAQVICSILFFIMLSGTDLSKQSEHVKQRLLKDKKNRSRVASDEEIINNMILW